MAKLTELKIKEEAPADKPVRVLTEDQQVVFAELLDFCKEKEKVMHLLEGFAGTGKTFIMQELISWVKENQPQNLAVTATTNKAVKVIHRAIGDLAEGLEVCTIHSLLGLKEKISNDGKVTFEPDRTKIRKIDTTTFVVIDESSMLPDDLFTECVLYAKRGVKFLFVGDGCQIPPVGKVSSIPFSEEDRKIYSIGHSMLTQIVRQKAGNPIIDLSKLIRERPNYRGTLCDLYPEAELNKGVGVAYLPSKEIDTFNALIKSLYTSPKFKEDADFVKTVAWRNDTVNKLNAKIRSYYLPEAEAKYVIGDKLVANSPITEDFENRVIVKYTTNDEFEVADIEEGVLLAEEREFKTYELTVFQIALDGSQVSNNITVIHPDSEELLKHVADGIKKAAIKLTDNPKMRAEFWIRYYGLAKLFADVKYNYCITAHKSQGSTYENCIVIEDDININPGVLERSKIKYTAVTRAAKRLIIVA